MWTIVRKTISMQPVWERFYLKSWTTHGVKFSFSQYGNCSFFLNTSYEEKLYLNSQCNIFIWNQEMEYHQRIHHVEKIHLFYLRSKIVRSRNYCLDVFKLVTGPNQDTWLLIIRNVSWKPVVTDVFYSMSKLNGTQYLSVL